MLSDKYRSLYVRYIQGRGKASQDGKEEGWLKVHTNIHANEGVPSDIRFTSAATNDSFKLNPANYKDGDIVAMMLMYYVNCYTFHEEPEKDWTK